MTIYKRICIAPPPLVYQINFLTLFHPNEQINFLTPLPPSGVTDQPYIKQSFYYRFSVYLIIYHSEESSVKEILKYAYVPFVGKWKLVCFFVHWKEKKMCATNIFFTCQLFLFIFCVSSQQYQKMLPTGYTTSLLVVKRHPKRVNIPFIHRKNTCEKKTC